MRDEKYITFLLKAKQETYAANGNNDESSRPNSYDLSYRDENLLYIDSYLGTHLFSGEEAIWDENNPVWALNYSGRVLDETKFSSKFLKKALMTPTFDYPFRGQPIYRDGDYTYTMQVNGDFNWFIGNEIIYCGDVVVYELNFHGGLVLDKHID